MNFPEKTLNKDIPMPLYYQIKEILLEYIRGSEAGNSIPTEQELCEHFDVSRQTVRQAIHELVVEGYLRRMKGKGTFITEQKIKQDFLIVLDSFNDDVQRKGLVPATKVLELTLAKSDERVSEALNLPVGSDIVRLRRLRFINNEPFVLVLTFLPYHKLSNILARNFERESLYDVIEKDYGYTIEGATMTLEANVAGDYEAQLLGLKVGDPIHLIERRTSLTDGTMIEYTLAEYRWDRNKFTLKVKKKHL